MSFFNPQNEDFSGRKVGIVIGAIVFVSWYITFYFLGWEYPDKDLQFILAIIGIAWGVNALQRSVFHYAHRGVSEVVKRGKQAAEPTVEAMPTAPEPAPELPQPKEEVFGFFKLSEFDSKDGAPMPQDVRNNVMRLISNLNIIREALGAPIRINSGYRSPEHNKKVGGSANSKHMEGIAADIVVAGYTPRQVRDKILELMLDEKVAKGGLKAYDTFVHYDIRGNYVTL